MGLDFRHDELNNFQEQGIRNYMKLNGMKSNVIHMKKKRIFTYEGKEIENN